MDRATFLDLMDKYIDGIMSDAEKYEFDLMLTNDPSLQQEFNTHKTLRKGIKLSGRNDLIIELNSIKKDVSLSNSGNIKKNFIRVVYIICSGFSSSNSGSFPF
jgi:hypothetical protein